MASIGDISQPGSPAPAAGAYQCTGSGCTSSFLASLAGAPLPTAHHSGAAWKLTAATGATPAAAKQATVVPPRPSLAGAPPTAAVASAGAPPARPKPPPKKPASPGGPTKLA